jgi:hypothetical protein
MTRHETFASRHGPLLAAASCAAFAFAVFIWMVSMAAAVVDSVPVALVFVTIVLLAPASTVVRFGQRRR